MSRAPRFASIFLHAGLPASDADGLQRAVAELCARGRLERLRMPGQAIGEGGTAGNAEGLAALIRAPASAEALRAGLEEELTKLLDGVEGGNLLLSSERLLFGSVEGLKALRDVLSPLANEVKMLLVVPPLRDSTWSVYMREVSEHGFEGVYDAAWLDGYCADLVTALDNLRRAAFAPMFLPYRRPGLLGSFLEALGEDPVLASEPGPAEPRELDLQPLEVVRLASRLFHSPELSRAVAAAMRARWPDGQAPAIPAEYAEVFEKFAGDPGSQLGRLRGEGMAKVRSLLLPAAPAVPAVPATDAAGMPTRAELLEVLLETLASFAGEQGRQAAHYQRLLDYSGSLVPSDAFFDPLHYLIRYPDLLAARVDPWAHYLEFGRAEGRTGALVLKESQ